MAANTVWGVDIGNSAIKAVKMVRDGDTCKIVDFDIVDIPGSEDDKDRAIRLQAAMTSLTNSLRFGNDPIYMSIAGNVCLPRDIPLPPGSEGKLAELVQYEARQQIPFPLDQVEWGYERYDDANGVGAWLIAVRKTDIQELLNLCEVFKLNLKGIAAAPMSLYNFIKFEFNPQSTTLILDAGAKGTDFVVMNKRQLYFRTIQIAGREITRVLENKFKVSYEKAEELKKNISQSPQMDRIFQVIEPTLKQLSAEVQRTIGFYKSKSRGQKIQQCYLLGHTFRLPKMAEYLQSQLREAPFALVEGLQRVRLDEAIEPKIWENEFPTMAVAIGLGLQGLNQSELTLNLLPQEKKAEGVSTSWKKWSAAAALVIMGTLGFSYHSAEAARLQYETTKEEVAKLKSDIDKAKQAVKKIEDQVPATDMKRQRFLRVGRDRGRAVAILNRVLSLKTRDNKPVFSLDNGMTMSNFYVSRAPFNASSSFRLATGKDADKPSEVRSKIENVEFLAGQRGIYAYLETKAEIFSVPLESRQEVPLVVIVTGEAENSDGNGLQRMGSLEAVLKTLEEIPNKPGTAGETVEKLVSIERKDNESYSELVPDYLPLPDGQIKNTDASGAPINPQLLLASAKPRPVIIFNAIFRWNDKNDLDIEKGPEIERPAPRRPSTPAPAPTPDKEGGA